VDSHEIEQVHLKGVSHPIRVFQIDEGRPGELTAAEAWTLLLYHRYTYMVRFYS